MGTTTSYDEKVDMLRKRFEKHAIANLQVSIKAEIQELQEARREQTLNYISTETRILWLQKTLESIRKEAES